MFLTTSPFVDRWTWRNYREITEFRNQSELDAYQSGQLKYISKVHGKTPDDCPVTDQIPKARPGKWASLKRSGTSSSLNSERWFLWSRNVAILDAHHIWKIEKSHGLLQPGPVVFVQIRSEPFEGHHFLPNTRMISLYGPERHSPVGVHNQTYFLYYSCQERKYSRHNWEDSLRAARQLSPKFFRCAPSTIEYMYHFFDGEKFPCPVISSDETLTQRVRGMAEQMFSKVIDKMVCWDGCLGWFECNKGRKHVYDEFAIVKFIDGRMVTTDLNNEATPFFNYCNKDYGDLRTGLCECGLYGNYFASFQGKYIENIYNGRRFISGQYLSETLTGLLRGAKPIMDSLRTKLNLTDNRVFYRFHQEKDGTIKFVYLSQPEFSEEQLFGLQAILLFLLGSPSLPFVMSKAESLADFERHGTRSKSLEIYSEFMKTLTPDELSSLRSSGEFLRPGCT